MCDSFTASYSSLIYVLLFSSAFSDEGLFQRDVGGDMKIGLAEGGYKSVRLKCGSNSMHVDLETEGDFSGVIYTKGSFYDKGSPCFFDPGYAEGQRSFSIRFPLDKCRTLRKGKVFSNVLVLQHDKDLIMPGDAAFNLECDFRKPRDITVTTELNSVNETIASRITLTDADPSASGDRRHGRSVESDGNFVEITPDKVKRLN